MAAFGYARAADTAQRLIAAFGQSMTLIKRENVGTTLDPVHVETEYPVTGVDLEVGETDPVAMVAVTRRKVYLAPDAEPPALTDRIRIGATENTIASVSTLAPGGTVVFYEVDLGTP